MSRIPLNMDDLLGQLGSTQIPEDSDHRYRLRRELLCSRYFGDHHARQQRWNRFVTFTMPLFTGGMLVVVFAIVGSSLSESSIGSPNQVPAIVQITDASREPEFQSSDFIDPSTVIPIHEVMKFIPVATVDYVFMR